MKKMHRVKLACFTAVAIILTVILPGEGLRNGTNIICNNAFAETLEYDVNKQHIVINQVYGAGKDGYVSHSFIELYNPTNITTDMGGWNIQYKSSEDGKVSEWQRLELTGSINAHSSYLIRCKAVSDNSNVNYTIESFDQEWDMGLHNKGLSVVLISGDDNLDGSDVFDNTIGRPVLDNYVDMLSVAGNDYDESDKKNKKQKPYHYERSFSAVQSKKNSIRRKGFKDTDNNAEDTEAVNYSKDRSTFYNYRPRSGADGQWTSDEIKFNVSSGFYDDPFELQLSTLADGEIYYTVDGSNPVPGFEATMKYEGSINIDDATGHSNVYSMRTDTSLAYTIPGLRTGTVLCDYKVPDFSVDKCTIIRAAVFKDGERISDIFTQSYFVDMKERDCISNTYVASLTLDPEDLFGYENGIYVLGKANGGRGIDYEKPGEWFYSSANYKFKGKDWERKAAVDLYDPNGEKILSQSVGVRIKGSSSRAYAQKSLNIYSREEYDGNKRIKYDLFLQGKEPKGMVLFSGSNDFDSKCKDYIISKSLYGNTNIDTLQFIPCALFLNGEYWGMYFINEKYDDKYISNKYGVKDSDVLMIKNGAVEEGDDKDISIWNEMRSFIADNDMEDDENFKKVCDFIDMDSFIHYYAAEIYIGNTDWRPTHNYAAWRSKKTAGTGYNDGKWRWLLFDVNFSTLQSVNRDNIAYSLEKDPVFRSLMMNATFRSEFAKVLSEMGNNYFNSSKMNNIIDQFEDEYADALDASYKRFKGGSYKSAGLSDDLNDRKKFFEKRYSAINSYMKRYMDNPSLIYPEGTITHIDSVPEDCQNTGLKEYWKNERTKRIYADKECMKPVTEKDLVIPASGHSFIDTIVNPTKSEKGYTEHVCSKCGYTFKDNYIEYIEPKVPETPNEETRVPLLKNSTYASSADNFAPVLKASNIKNLALDFSNADQSSIDGNTLSTTVIQGSVLKTVDEVASVVSTEKKLKVKLNKKTGIAKVTANKSGNVVFNMKNGKTYTISFVVEKPKAVKKAKEMKVEPGKTVSLSVQDLFGTSIDAGSMKILSHKIKNNSEIKENKLFIKPECKDRIRAEYSYLNKKYRITINVK